MISLSAPAGAPVFSPICCPNCGSSHVDQIHRQDPEVFRCTCCGLVDDLLQFRPAHLLGRPTPAPAGAGVAGPGGPMNHTVITSITGHPLAHCATPDLAEQARRVLQSHSGPNSFHLLLATGLERDASGAPLPLLTTEDDLRLVDAVWCTFDPEVECVMVLPVVTLKGLGRGAAGPGSVARPGPRGESGPGTDRTAPGRGAAGGAGVAPLTGSAGPPCHPDLSVSTRTSGAARRPPRTPRPLRGS